VISCAEVRRELVAALRGEVGTDVAHALERHVERCAGCAAERESLLRTMDVVHRHVHPEMSADARLRLDEALATELGRMRIRASRRRLIPFIAAPLAAAAGALFALTLAPSETHVPSPRPWPVALADPVQRPGAGELAPKAADAAERAYEWLASQQRRDGSWSPTTDADPESSATLTGSVLLAFAADQGSFHDLERREAVARGVRRLTELLDAKFSDDPDKRPLFAQAFAVSALAAVYKEARESMSTYDRRTMRDLLANAGIALVRWQRDDGGWGTASKSMRSEASCTLAALAALEQLRAADILDAPGPAGRGSTYLAAQRNPASPPSVSPATLETATAMSSALLRHGGESEPVRELLAKQRPDGSWSAGADAMGAADPMTTAWGALTLAMNSR
jgi:prenyltransferase/squalene oxidase-like repeat protein